VLSVGCLCDSYATESYRVWCVVVTQHRRKKYILIGGQNQAIGLNYKFKNDASSQNMYVGNSISKLQIQVAT
jgi:hypothetical protein